MGRKPLREVAALESSLRGPQEEQADVAIDLLTRIAALAGGWSAGAVGFRW